MSEYTMKTASLKSTIILSNIVLVGDATLINKRGINTNNIVSDSIITSLGKKYLTEDDIQQLSQTPQKITDGRNCYTGDSSINEVHNDLFVFSTKSEEIDLNSLSISGDSSSNGMFANSSITSFVCDLPKLNRSAYMFYNSNLEKFASYTQNLVEANSMFEGCDKLTEIIADFSMVQDAKNMFYNCSSMKFGKLDLSSVGNAEGMFYGCKLDGKNVVDILDTIQENEETPRIDIGVTIDGLKAIHVNTGAISFSDFNFEHNRREYYVQINEEINDPEDLGYEYILCDESDCTFLEYSPNIYNVAEHTDGFFIENPTITSFGENINKVKTARGMFFGLELFTTFTSSVPNLEDATHMFALSGLTAFEKALPKCKYLDYAFRSTPITTFTSDLSNVESAAGAFKGCESLKNGQSYGSFNKLINGDSMFSECSLITSFDYDLPLLVYGNSMFSSSKGIKTFASSLPNLEEGEEMFSFAAALTSFTSELPKIKIADSMFNGATVLATFTSEMPELVYANSMFRYTKLTSVSMTLPKLKEANLMFDQCKSIKTFSLIAPELETGDSILSCAESAGAVTTVHLDAPKMKNCWGGFNNCTSLTSFTGDLSSLLDGTYMFYGCKLDGSSVANIYNSIQTITIPKSSRDKIGELCIGINSTYSSTASTNATRLNNFGVAAGFADWAALKQAFVDKGWNVSWYYAASGRLIEV